MDEIKEAIKKIEEIDRRQVALSEIAFNGLKDYMRELDENEALDFRGKFMRVYGYIEAFMESYDLIANEYKQGKGV